MAIPPESHFIPVAWGVRHRYVSNGSCDVERLARTILGTARFREWRLPEERVWKQIRALDAPTFAEVIEAFFVAYAESHGKPRWGDKTPGYSLEMLTLAKLFPDARFVHVVRDARNVVMSLCETFSRVSPIEAAAAWSHRVRRGREDGRRLGAQRYMELRYEALVEDPTAVLSAVCDFINLDYQPEMLKYADRLAGSIPERERRIHRNLIQPPTGGLRDWRNEMATGELALVEAVAGDQLSELEYERRFLPVPAAAVLRARLEMIGKGMSHAGWRARRLAIAALRPETLPPDRRW